MNKRLCLSLIVCLFSIISYSQNSLKGKLLNENKEPVAFANVILLNAEDSTSVYKGVVSEEDGNFLLENLDDQNYVLKVTFIGYEDYLKKIKLSHGRTDLKSITLKEASDALDEITVKARKPKITKEIDRLVFDVENSNLSSGNTWDVLRKAPGVIDNQGQLMVRNTSVQVYLNDHKIYLSASELKSLLESYSAENVESIEIITNPPAKYDAEGGAILNIHTSKAISAGYKGSLEGTYTQSIYPKFKIGTSHYFQGDRLNVFANYSYSPRKDYKNDDSYINFIRNGGLYSRWDTDFTRETTSQAHNANAIIDYELSDNSSLNFSVNANFSPDKEFDNDVVTEIRNSQKLLDSTLISNSRILTDQDNIAANLGYTTSFENGGEFSVKGHYTKFEQDRNQKVFSRYIDPSGDELNSNAFETVANQDIDIFTAQADYSTSIGGSAFNTGAKFSGIESDSKIDYLNAGELQDLYDNLSDNFLYHEKIYALYTSLSHEWEKWSAKVGLRGEYTDRQGESITLDKINNREYFELFPTAYLQYRVSDANSFTLDYSRRINRPRYESLNPFRYFLNETDYNAGNPNLEASISNNFNLNYTLKNSWFFDLYFYDYGNTPETLAFQDNQNLTIRRVSQNNLDGKGYGLNIMHNRSITRWWYLQAYASFFHEGKTFLAVESGNIEVTRDIEGVLAYTYNIFTLSNDGTFEGNILAQYLSRFLSGSYVMEPMTTVSIGLRKTLWNNRAELTLNFNDIFNTTNTRLTSEYLNQSNSYKAFEEMRNVQVGFKYNFGNFRLSDNERSIDEAERERLNP